MKMFLLLALALPYVSCQGSSIVGGQTPITASLTDLPVVFGLAAINKQFTQLGDARPRTAEQILYATSQVVAGIKYKFTIKVSGGDSAEICNVTVWSRSWLSEPEAQQQIVGSPVCAPEKPAAAPLVGGQEEVTLSDPQVQEALGFLESQVNAKSNSLFYLKAASAKKVTKQVVNGVIYRFSDVALTVTSCTQVEVRQNTNKVCTASTNSEPIATCSYEVYWNPRETPAYTLKNDSCAKN